ncbi:MAG TPA: glycosyltransferase, partial [Burkholderiales bacterium]|nr:glycosyltransferase [Burkholderiales bacterium]
MRRVAIGVHVHAEPHRLRATLASLRASTSGAFDLLLLPDGPDSPTRAALATLPDLPQLPTEEARGAPACFNRLAASTDADVIVLLESGSQVGPGWLDRLIGALNADPRNGLAGPSTNRSWNEQCVFPTAGSTPADVARAAREALSRFGTSTRTLEPLYSLADFCYAVRREVIDAIGAADDAYGLGPCWEMDYNIRAARAGFRGVWACSAYVHRFPFTARRHCEEAMRFEAAKRRYQDKFCALKLRAERSGYEPHCRGGECEHFAPAGSVQIQLPVRRAARELANNERPSGSVHAEPPLVSCIMPTRGRGDFVLQSIRYFERQDYPNRELIIIDDGPEELSQSWPQNIRYFRTPAMSIGAKRNRACELARGSLIAQWDDDDWYGASRLTRQVAPLMSGEADITGFTAGVFFELDAWQFWRCTPQLHRRLFVNDVHGGTLVYARRVWERLARYPDASLAEDAAFLRQAMERGARLRRLDSDNVFIYLRHGGNAWRFPCGQYLDPSGWRRVDESPLAAEDRAFYQAHSRARAERPHAVAELHSRSSCRTRPLASCIMPTADRRYFARQAIHYFERQDYARKELIIVDDGRDAIADLIPDDKRIRYIRLDTRMSVGAKRNRACEQAQGDVIVHWDDDDWYSPRRLTYQIQALLEEEKAICGINNLLFFDQRSRRAYRYVYPAGERAWVYGSSLCYSKEFWKSQRFSNIDVGEDALFVWAAPPEKVKVLTDPRFQV